MAIPSPQVISTVDTVSDQRLDIDGVVWQLSTNTSESVILYGITDNAGTNYEIGYLKERPAPLNFYGGNAAPAVSGETEVTTLGAIASTKFYVDYDRAFMLFPNGHATPVSVTYKGLGSIQKAKDVNEAIRAAEFANERYLGGVTGSAPSVDANGVTLASGHEGILYFDNDDNKLKVWDGSAWGNATSAVEGVMSTVEVAGSGSTGSPSNQWYAFVHDATLQQVFLNGVRQIANTDYKSVNSNSSTTHMTSGTPSHIYFVSATDSADVVSMVAFGTVTSISVVPAGGGSFTGAVAGTDLTLSGNLTVNGTTTTVNTTVTISDAMVINNAGSDIGLKVNSTSSGHIIQLQDDGVDKFVIADGGALTYTGAATITGSLAVTTTTTATGLITANGGLETDTNSKVKQKGAFMQSSTHQAMVLGG